MEFFIYQADVYCPECTRDIKEKIRKEAGNGKIYTRYSDTYPQGPYDNEEADTPQHCGSCGVFLEQPLTTQGYDYTRQLILENPDGPGSKVWREFYGSDVEPLEENKDGNND